MILQTCQARNAVESHMDMKMWFIVMDGINVIIVFTEQLAAEFLCNLMRSLHGDICFRWKRDHIVKSLRSVFLMPVSFILHHRLVYPVPGNTGIPSDIESSLRLFRVEDIPDVVLKVLRFIPPAAFLKAQ